MINGTSSTRLVTVSSADTPMPDEARKEPPGAAMRVDDALAENLKEWSKRDCGRHIIAWWWGSVIADLLHDRAEMLAELARLRGKPANQDND